MALSRRSQLFRMIGALLLGAGVALAGLYLSMCANVWHGVLNYAVILAFASLMSGERVWNRW